MISIRAIIAYDVESSRTEIFKKICQKYLVRIQNSVFEGEITKAQLMRIKDSLENEINENESVRVWVTSKILKTYIIGSKNEYEDGFL